jgi:hypothetical protein
VPDEYQKLWKPPSGELFSNTVTLTVREPTAIEKEILNPLWTSGSAVFSAGDNVLGPSGDEDALETVISKYPDHPLTAYARLFLAKSYLRLRDPSVEPQRIERGVELLNELVESHPSFRYEEVRHLLAIGLERSGDREAAIDLVQDTLRLCPGLNDNLPFMNYKIILETGDPKQSAIWLYERSGRSWNGRVIRDENRDQ